MTLWLFVLLIIAGIALGPLCIISILSLLTKLDEISTADVCAKKACNIFNLFIILNFVGAVIGAVILGCNSLYGEMIGCLIDATLGSLGLLLFKLCWRSLFLVIKEKK